ncbi:hypothetical protein BH11BAC5_BH11BAC5_38300 [soil metagenome]
MVAIKAVKSIFGAKPQKAIVVLRTAKNGTVGKTVFNLVVPEKIRLCPRLKRAENQEQKNLYKLRDMFFMFQTVCEVDEKFELHRLFIFYH